MKNVRVWFRKTGAVKYISHLDLTRCMARGLKLSGLPVWYTQGFNPRIYMNFAMPLSLGVSGERECMDIRLTEDMDLSQAARQLAGSLPEDISILEITEPVWGFDAIAFAEYELSLESDNPQGLAADLDDMLAAETVIVMKHGKKGDKPLDIKPHFGGLEKEIRGSWLDLRVKLPCTQDGSINPNLLLEALRTHKNQEPYARITRKRLLTKDFSDMR